MNAKLRIVILLIALPAAVPAAAAPPDEAALKQRYNNFVQSSDHRSLAKDYPGAIRNLDSPDPKKQIIGIKTLAATEEVKAIPWIVPFLDSEDRHVRIQAGLSLSTVVANHQLKRRDKSQSEKVVILPPHPGDIDLTSVSWVILKMLRLPDDGNTHAYAANMIGDLGLEEYEPELRKLLDSRHPAVTTAARRVLEMIDVKPADTLDDGYSANRYSTDLGKIEIALVPEPRPSLVVPLRKVVVAEPMKNVERISGMKLLAYRRLGD